MTKNKRMELAIDALFICHDLMTDLWKKDGRSDDRAGEIAAFVLAATILELHGLLKGHSYIKPFLQISEALQRREQL